ncbi:MAG: hypothetical protein WDN45_07745 [Caulobacteraceae bacterium]
MQALLTPLLHLGEQLLAVGLSGPAPSPIPLCLGALRLGSAAGARRPVLSAGGRNGQAQGQAGGARDGDALEGGLSSSAAPEAMDKFDGPMKPEQPDPAISPPHSI